MRKSYLLMKILVFNKTVHTTLNRITLNHDKTMEETMRDIKPD